MADNAQLSTNVGTGKIAATASLSFSGDTADVQIVGVGMLSGSEGSWAMSLATGGAGAVSAGTPRVTLASDDPAVSKLTSIDSDTSNLNDTIGTDGAASVPTKVVMIGGHEGSITYNVHLLRTHADDQLNTQNALVVANYGYVFDGTTWDRMRGTSTDGLLVNLGSNNDVTVTGTVSGTGTAGTAATGVVTIQGIASMTAIQVADNSGSLTVDAPVGTPVFVRLSDGSAAITTLPVSLASVPSHAVTNAGTFAVQVDGTALMKLTDIETNTDAGAVVGNGAAATAQRVTLANDSTGIVALTTSTASIGKLASNTGVTIGAVEIAAAQTLATVTTVSTLTGGGVAHDGADSGNPIKIGAKASATLSDDTMVANADRTDATSDLDGALLTRTGFPLGDLITERTSNTDGASTAFTNFGATASARNYITAIVVYNSSATAGYVDIRDGTAGSILYTIPLPAGGGAVIGNGSTPILYSSVNTALAFDVSAALSTVYISASGFKSKVRA